MTADVMRRIGEFLKELELTEGRSTGIPKSPTQKYRLTKKGRLVADGLPHKEPEC